MKFRDVLRLVEKANPLSPGNGHDLDAFHGTSADFDAFDPDLTGDIGMHFGTAEQANVSAKFYQPEYPEGANVIPVKLRLKNPLRVTDMFSILRQRYIARAKTWTLGTRGFSPSDEERAAIYDAARAADKARSKAGGDYGKLLPSMQQHQGVYKAADRAFWDAIKASCIRQGYDGLVYANKSEGKGDSYVVFDAAQVRARHASFDPAKADSARLLDHAAPSMREAINLAEAMTRDEASGIFRAAGVDPTGLSAKAITQARNRLAKGLHPDAGGDMELMKQLNAAHDVLRQGGGTGPLRQASTKPRAPAPHMQPVEDIGDLFGEEVPEMPNEIVVRRTVYGMPREIGPILDVRWDDYGQFLTLGEAAQMLAMGEGASGDLPDWSRTGTGPAHVMRVTRKGDTLLLAFTHTSVRRDADGVEQTSAEFGWKTYGLPVAMLARKLADAQAGRHG